MMGVSQILNIFGPLAPVRSIEPNYSSADSSQELPAQQLAGKRAIVTGGGSGIGAAISTLFARHGAKVVVADLNEQSAKKVAAEINSEFPGSAVAIRVNVSLKADTIAMIDLCVKKFGGIDCFCANAGILNKNVPILEESEEDFMRTISVNALGIFMAIKYAGTTMAKSNGGTIICTASIAGIRADFTPIQYNASKGAVLSMIKSANDKLMTDGVRVNGIVPGGVMTPMVFNVSQNMINDGYRIPGYDLKRFPMIHPEEIANIAVFLASEASSCIKGHAIIADGGMSNSMGSQPYPAKISKH